MAYFLFFADLIYYNEAVQAVQRRHLRTDEQNIAIDELVGIPAGHLGQPEV
jgi:hypothetical protein